MLSSTERLISSFSKEKNQIAHYTQILLLLLLLLSITNIYIPLYYIPSAIVNTLSIISHLIPAITSK